MAIPRLFEARLRRDSRPNAWPAVFCLMGLAAACSFQDFEDLKNGGDSNSGGGANSVGGAGIGGDTATDTGGTAGDTGGNTGDTGGTTSDTGGTTSDAGGTTSDAGGTTAGDVGGLPSVGGQTNGGGNTATTGGTNASSTGGAAGAGGVSAAATGGTTAQPGFIGPWNFDITADTAGWKPDDATTATISWIAEGETEPLGSMEIAASTLAHIQYTVPLAQTNLSTRVMHYRLRVDGDSGTVTIKPFATSEGWMWGDNGAVSITSAWATLNIPLSNPSYQSVSDTGAYDATQIITVGIQIDAAATVIVDQIWME